MAEQMQVEVVYALPKRQSLLSVNIAVGSTVRQAIERSGILTTYSDIDLAVNKVGIWSRTAKLDEVLVAGDRVEIYRPLIADPKDMRKKRAEKAKEEGRADKVTGGRVHEKHDSEKSAD